MLLVFKKNAIIIFLLTAEICFNIHNINGQKSEPVKLNNYLIVAENLFNQYRYDSAVVYYDSALTQAEKMDNQDLVAYILQLKGTALRNDGRTDSANKMYKSARQIAVALGNDTICAMADIGIGNIYDKYGRLDSAEYFYNHALTLFQNSGDTVGIGEALYNLSMFYQSKIDYEISLKYALECNRIFKKFDKTELYCSSLLNLGNVYECLKEYDTALACYEQGKLINVKLNNLKLAAKFANNKAVIYYYQKKFEEAKNELLSAIEFNEKINDLNELSILYRNISVILKKLEKRDEALKYADKALSYARQINNKELLSDAHNLMWDMQIAYDNITLLYKAKGDFNKAYEYLQKYVAISDSITNEEKIKASEKYKAEYELLHLQDQNKIKDLKNKKILLERNRSYGIGATLVFILVVFLFYFRMRARKNRIIAAQKIQKLEDEKKLMAAQSVLVGQEKERERIARELHDGIGVLLSTASIHFSNVEEKADKETAEMLKKANKLLKEAGKEVRQISHNMMPGVLSKFGLREAIEDLFDDVKEMGDIEVDTKIICSDDKRLPENMEIMIYRIVQEMLNNTLKHAKATKISFNISRCDEIIQMDFTDNGVGFEEEKPAHGKNLGLSGLRSRVEYLGGTIELKSEKAKGTRYSIMIPLLEKI